ncbi:class I fructose-bisphosphate aldolase [Kribbella sp. NPDC050241]|uniref:class I fructose-bisphosphate aldolase n=1 Tax=Kribbella sp. NPDC050241 TaxID=3364115 RepID=UPI00378AC3F5
MPTMDETAAAILAPPKGMLVVDEYAEALVGADQAHFFAEAVLRTEGLSNYVSAVLLTPGTFTALGTTEAAPLIGVRMTSAEADVPAGASFVEWRENLSPLDVPRGSVHVGVETLALGAAAAQAKGILPVLTIAMPELGASSIGVTQAVTTNALLALRAELDRVGVDPHHLLLRINMVVPGLTNPVPADSEQVARRTVALLEKGVPAQTPGVLLLSGGQPLDRACAHLEAIASVPGQPWRVTFGFSRPLISAAAEAWSRGADYERVLLDNCRQASEAVAAALVSGGAAS